MATWRWRRRPKNKVAAEAVVAVANNSNDVGLGVFQVLDRYTPPEAKLFAAAIHPCDSADDNLHRLNELAKRVMLSRNIITEMMQLLQGHVATHKDPMDCDPWCGPFILCTALQHTNRHDLQDLFVILLKDYFWLLQTEPPPVASAT